MNYKKGTKGIITAVILILLLTAVIYFSISVIFSNSFTVKQYYDPKVAKTVINGSIYDSSGRILPDDFESTVILKNKFKPYISPIPELNVDITYGSDIYLTLDPTLQYSLNSDCKRFFDSYAPEILKVLILDYNTKEVLAYSFFGKDTDEHLLPKIAYNNEIIEPYIVLDIKSNKKEYGIESISQLNQSLLSDNVLTDSKTSSVIKLDSEKKSYLLAVQTDNVFDLLVYLQLMNEGL